MIVTGRPRLEVGARRRAPHREAHALEVQRPILRTVRVSRTERDVVAVRAARQKHPDVVVVRVPAALAAVDRRQRVVLFEVGDQVIGSRTAGLRSGRAARLAAGNDEAGCEDNGGAKQRDPEHRDA